MPQQKAMSLLLEFARPVRARLISSIVLAVTGALLGVLPYLAAAQIISLLCAGTLNLAQITWLAAAALVGYLASVWCAAVSTMISHRCAFSTLNSIRKALTVKLSRMPLGQITEQPSGKFKTLIVDTVEKLELPLAHLIPEVSANITVPLLILSYLFVLDWRLALISLVTIPIGVGCYLGMMRDYSPRYAKVLAAAKNMDAAMVEYIGGIEVIKGFNQATSSYQKYTDAIKTNEYAKTRWFNQTNPYYVTGVAIMPACLLGVLPLGSYLYQQEKITAPVLITCVILSLGLVKPLIQALRYTDSLAMVDTTVREVATLLAAPELNRPAEFVTLTNYQVDFDQVSFGYQDTEVLHEVSLSIKPNTMTALVGPSGSGKSTMARLIASFWEVDSGMVRIGGVDVRQLPLEQVLQLVSYVTQDNYLFDVSILENIKMGDPGATEEQVIAAAKAARCHDFITALPEGYETRAGTGGANLSGGERQRVTIARAILKNSPIVVLDEATAFTDPENETAIQESISGLVAGKTLVVIAHHLSTITTADQIVVLDRGRITASGRHQELLENCPLYRQLWEAQLELTTTGGAR